METPRPQITQNLIDTLVLNQYTQWMRELHRMPPDFLPRLQFARRHLPADLPAQFVGQMVTQLERRERAARKFARAEQMFFTAEGFGAGHGRSDCRVSRCPLSGGYPDF